MINKLFKNSIFTKNNDSINKENIIDHSSYHILFNDNAKLRQDINNINTNFQRITEANKNLNTQLSQLREENSKLTEENAQLREDNYKLTEENAQLQTVIVDLNRKLNLNSTNSSLPPSTDKFNKKKIYNNRYKSEKKCGGQEGHIGSNLQFETDQDKIDEKVDIKPTFCSECNTPLENFTLIDTRQTHDIVITKKITNHYIYKGLCKCGCESNIQSDIKLPSHGVSYGDTYKATMIYLHNQNYIPLERLASLSEDLFDIHVSEATIINFQNSIVENLNIKFLNDLEERIIKSDLVMADETGMKVANKTQWAHVLCNDNYTLYNCHPNRGHKAMDEIGILSKLNGCLVTDAYTSYQKFTNVKAHGLCNAHLLRELRSLEDYNVNWSNKLSTLLIKMNNTYKLTDYNETTKTNLINEYDEIISLANLELDNLLNNQKEYNKVKTLIKRLTNKKNNYLAFLTYPEIPFTNNQSERDIRMVKLKEKISGKFKTEKGANNFLQMRSFISTMKKNGKNIIKSIVKIIFDPGDYTFKK